MKNIVRTISTILTAITLFLPTPILALENILGADWISTKSSGNVCDLYGPDSGCEDNNESMRIYYGARISPDIEIRGSYSFLDIKLTDDTDDFFNSPSVSSEVLDVSVIFLWQLNDSWHANVKAGLGLWTETLPGGGFFDSSGSSTGVSPVVGGELEWGHGSLRATANIDLYPSMDNAEIVTILGVGLRFVW